jgi:hypothetical protein
MSSCFSSSDMSSNSSAASGILYTDLCESEPGSKARECRRGDACANRKQILHCRPGRRPVIGMMRTFEESVLRVVRVARPRASGHHDVEARQHRSLDESGGLTGETAELHPVGQASLVAVEGHQDTGAAARSGPRGRPSWRRSAGAPR